MHTPTRLCHHQDDRGSHHGQKCPRAPDLFWSCFLLSCLWQKHLAGDLFSENIKCIDTAAGSGRSPNSFFLHTSKSISHLYLPPAPRSHVLVSASVTLPVCSRSSGTTQDLRLCVWLISPSTVSSGPSDASQEQNPLLF